MRLEILEGIPNEPVGERVGFTPGLELQQQALAQVPGADARRVELLDDAEYLLGLGQRVQLGGHVVLRLIRVGLEHLIYAVDDLFEGGAEVAVFRDVPDELFSQELLAGRQVEQRHVQQIHRLIQARIDPQLLGQRRVLLQAGFHAAWVRRARSRAVRVGPRYRFATRSSNTSSRTVPATCTLPSNMM